MTTLSDLTIAQIARAYGALTGIPTTNKSFNTKAKAQQKLEAVMAEKDLTLADVLDAAGMTPDPSAATAPVDDALEQDVAAAEAGFTMPADTAEEPEAPAIDETAEAAPEETLPETPAPAEPEEAAPEETLPDEPVPTEPAPETAPAEDGATTEDAAPATDADDEAPAPDPAAILTSNKVVNDVRDMVIRYLVDTTDLDDETVVYAALRAVAALKPPASKATPDAGTARPPKGDTKMATLISLLERPSGATIDEIAAELGWQRHSIHGAIAGHLKKKLGLTVISEKTDGRARIYRISGMRIS